MLYFIFMFTGVSVRSGMTVKGGGTFEREDFPNMQEVIMSVEKSFRVRAVVIDRISTIDKKDYDEWNQRQILRKASLN